MSPNTNDSQHSQGGSSSYRDRDRNVERLDSKTENEWKNLSNQILQVRAANNCSKSNEFLSKAAERTPESPTSPAFRLWMADNLAIDGNYPDAVTAYDHCINASQLARPFTSTQDFISGALFHRSQLFYLMGHHSRAIESYRELFNYRPENKIASLQAGLIAEQIGQKNVALEFYKTIASAELSAHTDDPAQLARRAIERINDQEVTYFQNATELAETLTMAIERGDLTRLNQLVSKTHFAVGPAGGHTAFESPDIYEEFIRDLRPGGIKLKRMLLGSGSKRYIPTGNWTGKCFQGEVSLIITRAPNGWQWTGIALNSANEFWIERWRPRVIQTNDPLPFELRAPWPKDQCFTAGGLWQYVAEQASVLAAGIFAPIVAEGLSTGCCGWGPRGYYYNTGPTHDEEDAFAIDFTRYRRFVPYDNESGGTPVLAAHDGVVSKVRAGVASGDSSMDNRVEVHHADPANPGDTTRFTSKYLHLEGPWRIPVSEGMSIRTGTRLGLMDDTGNSVLDHLHFSIHDRQLTYPGAPEGRSVRPTPISGVTLGDSDSNKCVRSNNIEYTGTNQMIYPKSFAGQNWLIVPVGLAVNQTPPASISNQKWMMVLSGVAILDFKGNGSEWLRETVHILPDIVAPMNHAINTFNIPVPGGGQGYTLQFQIEQWVPHATPSSIYNKGQSVNSGFAVDVWRPHPFVTDTDVITNQTINNCFNGIVVDVAVSDIDAYFYRISYHITLIGKIRFGQPIIIL